MNHSTNTQTADRRYFRLDSILLYSIKHDDTPSCHIPTLCVAAFGMWMVPQTRSRGFRVEKTSVPCILAWPSFPHQPILLKFTFRKWSRTVGTLHMVYKLVHTRRLLSALRVMVQSVFSSPQQDLRRVFLIFDLHKLYDRWALCENRELGELIFLSFRDGHFS